MLPPLNLKIFFKWSNLEWSAGAKSNKAKAFEPLTHSLHIVAALLPFCFLTSIASSAQLLIWQLQLLRTAMAIRWLCLAATVLAVASWVEAQNNTAGQGIITVQDGRFVDANCREYQFSGGNV